MSCSLHSGEALWSGMFRLCEKGSTAPPRRGTMEPARGIIDTPLDLLYGYEQYFLFHF